MTEVMSSRHEETSSAVAYPAHTARLVRIVALAERLAAEMELHPALYETVDYGTMHEMVSAIREHFVVDHLPCLQCPWYRAT